MTENLIQQDNTPEIEEMKERFEEVLKEAPSKIDYRIRNKKIWKGKVAPLGYKFIVIDFVKYKHGYVNSILVEGDYTPEEEAEIAEMLRDQLRKKYRV